MQVKLLHTTGNGVFEETTWDKPEPKDTEIEVKAVMTGVCRSDVAMMQGSFGPLPLRMQGHEGLGVVTRVGSSVNTVKAGDYVATRGEPAYADYYNTRQGEFVVVPELDPRYIIEPVACGINCVLQPLEEIKRRSGRQRRCLILGSGFLAWIVYHSLSELDVEFDEVVVVGNHNKPRWGDRLRDAHTGRFDVVIDLSTNTDVLDRDCVNNEALIVFGVQKQLTTDYGNLLWRACTLIFPSPRSQVFAQAMQLGVKWIQQGSLDVSGFWTRGYHRHTEWQQAFKDAAHRQPGYTRGYIKWD